MKPAVDDAQSAGPSGRVEPRRRASAHEDRVDFLRFAQRRRDLAFEGGEVTVGQMVDARQRREVAISALVGAERNMHVRRSRPEPARLDRFSGDGRNSRNRLEEADLGNLRP